MIKIKSSLSYVCAWIGSNSDIGKTVRSTQPWLSNSNTVLIGGLFNSSDTDNTSKVPLLGNLPAQHIFTSKRSKDQTELVIITLNYSG